MGLKVVVTGGSGFIGSHVVDALVAAGHAVTIIDHRVAPHRRDVEFEDVDLLDLASVVAVLRGADHVFHLGAVANVNYAFKYPVYTASLNVMGTTNILEAARIVGFASFAEYSLATKMARSVGEVETFLRVISPWERDHLLLNV